MSVEARVKEWVRKMGYDGEIPSSLSKICNASTAFIWEQLMTNVKPRQEVEYVKKNVIVNRLSTKPLEQQDQFSFQIKEIEVYTTKKKLEKHIEHCEKELEEKESKIDELLKKNSATYVTIDNIKAKIKENQERKFLLDKKSELIQGDIQHAKESLTLARNLTPVEMDVNPSGEEITKTLQKCAEKLQKLSGEISLPKTHTSRSSVSVLQSAKTPKYSAVNTFSRYLNMSTTLTDIAPSARKNKNEGNRNYLQNQTASKCLQFEDDDANSDKNRTKRKPQRESLGLLPAACLNTSDDLDAFLLGSQSDQSILQPLSDSTLDSSGNKNFGMVEKLYKDEIVKELLKNLLHKNNRYLILSQCKVIYEQLITDVQMTIMECSKLTRLERGIGQSDMTSLYLMHMKNELEKEKCQIVLKKLLGSVKRKKEEILFQLCNKMRNTEEVKKNLDLQIEDAFLKGANNFLCKEINATKKVESDNEQQVIIVKIKKAEEEIMYKNECIQSLISATFNVLEDIRSNREETSSCVKKLAPYIQDMGWTNTMTQEMILNEVETFKQFPLEYNRNFKYNQPQTLYRSVSDSKLPSYIQTNSDNLEMITTLLDKPFTPAENVIFDVLRTKVVANKLKSMESPVELADVPCNTYTMQDLSKREDYVDPVIDKLNLIINSDSVKETLSAPSDMEEITNLWLEMPFKNFISEKRQVDDHLYKFYQKVFEELKNS